MAPSPCLSPNATLAPHLAVAVTAVDRAALTGLERHLALLATRSTNRVVQLPAPVVAVAIAITAPLSPSSTALRTPLGLIGEAPAGEQLLLVRTEDKTPTALHTLERLVDVVHG